jgi:hypothetical protein
MFGVTSVVIAAAVIGVGAANGGHPHFFLSERRSGYLTTATRSLKFFLVLFFRMPTQKPSG